MWSCDTPYDLEVPADGLNVSGRQMHRLSKHSPDSMTNLTDQKVQINLKGFQTLWVGG